MRAGVNACANTAGTPWNALAILVAIMLYVTRMIDLQSSLLMSFRRNLNQPRPLFIISYLVS